MPFAARGAELHSFACIGVSAAEFEVKDDSDRSEEI
jgi:hypothetical protein